MPGIEKIIGLVTVKPHAMMGRSTHSSKAPLHTGYGKKGQKPAGTRQPAAPAPGRSLSPVTVIAGAGAIACLLAAVALWLRQRRIGVT
jgi:hypothetical protein